MDKYKKLPFSALPFIGYALIAAIAIVEFYSPTGVYLQVAYVVAILLTFYAEDKLSTIVAAVASALAIMFSVFYSHANEDFNVVTTNLSISLAGVTVTMFFVLYVKNLRGKSEENTKQITSLFSHATEGIILTNRVGEIVLVNPHAETLFGYTKEELIGKRIEILIPENLKRSHERQREGFHHKPVNRTMGGGRDLFARRKDGSVFPVEISLSHYRSGKDAFVVAFIIDITVRKKGEELLEQKRTELENVSKEIRQLNVNLEQKVSDRTMMLRETLAQLEKSKDELATALEKEKELGDLKSRFVSTVSHEFRTPLSTILSSASLLGKYIQTDEQPKRERHIARIKDSVQHMSAMLEDLLSLGRLEEGLVEVKKDTFDFAHFFEDFVAEMKEINQKGQRIEYTHTGPVEVFGDRRLIKIILLNLVSNAVKFSDEGGTIWVNSENKNGTLTLSVKDSGIGISEEDVQHLFERFFRARNAINIQGTGLGLHIIYKYLELMGGNINVHSKLGEGSIFTAAIPSV
ncbi:MAG: PAS domain S-box protein [Chitinophagales bacterium]